MNRMKKNGTAAKTLRFELFHATKQNSGWNCWDVEGCWWVRVGRIWEDDDKTLTSEDLCNKVSCKERNNCYFQIIFLPITLSTKIFLDWVP